MNTVEPRYRVIDWGPNVARLVLGEEARAAIGLSEVVYWAPSDGGNIRRWVDYSAGVQQGWRQCVGPFKDLYWDGKTDTVAIIVDRAVGEYYPFLG